MACGAELPQPDVGNAPVFLLSGFQKCQKRCAFKSIYCAKRVLAGKVLPADAMTVGGRYCNAPKGFCRDSFCQQS
jgi:hypothetical protein